MKELVIDISEWQGDFDLAKAKKEHNLYGVIIRIGGSYKSGGFYDDDEFENNYKKAIAANLHVGAYFYSTAQNTVQAKKDAEYTIKKCAGKKFDLPIYMDVEESYQLTLGLSTLTEVIKTWLKTVDEGGLWGGIYMSRSPFQTAVYSDQLIDGWATWLAEWSDSLNGFSFGDEVGMWQFGGSINTQRSTKINGMDVDQNWIGIDYPTKIKAAGKNGYKATVSPQQRVINKALSQVGYVASSGKHTKYAQELDAMGDVYNGPKDGYDWCDVFADWNYITTFGKNLAVKMINQPLWGGGAGCWLSASYYRSANQWSTKPSLGAQIFFGTYGDEGHTGIVVGYTGSTVTTVEGNTGYSAGYSSGAVLKRTYDIGDNTIVGYGIPKWDLAGGADLPTEPTNSYADIGKLDVDGYLGVQSITAWQTALGTTVDGIISGQGNSDYPYHVRLNAVSYESGGSELVRAIQRKVGASVDGYLGPQTIRAIQQWLNDNCGESLDTDGYLGPLTAQAIQRSLNNDKW